MSIPLSKNVLLYNFIFPPLDFYCIIHKAFSQKIRESSFSSHAKHTRHHPIRCFMVKEGNDLFVLSLFTIQKTAYP